MSLLTLLLLLSLSPPQEYQLQLSFPGQATQNFMRHQSQSRQTLDRNQIDRIQTSEYDCFAIRSYIFKREDGNAPELVGTTTCTPSSAFRNRTVSQPPPARLVPLN